ncbi:17-beta-hydroxysteroid dehydrogenase type 6 [Nephila pilipes]|uniref:17-beta-hydroxysteroid dehydrogenase type 6 n=1 Tax=Nephila pilipes TaxID=299642 RepID=A0A8X6MAJ4_NEPPI|nr:17-beta-hydroxysteroid dehydrogenase type 6 [Nephila pilipes]
MLLAGSVFLVALVTLLFAAMKDQAVDYLFASLGFTVVVVYTANIITRWILSILPKDVVSSEGKAVLITGISIENSSTRYTPIPYNNALSLVFIRV